MSQDTHTEILRPRMLYEGLADAVREQIFRHELAPGDSIDEFRLAKGFGVSRTPLREALKVLAGEGIVELRARQGCYVTRLTWLDALQLLDVLDLLEAFAVREAAKVRAAIQIGESLQRSLGKASGNVYLPDLVERLIAKLCLAFGSLFDSPELQPSPELWAGLEQSIAGGDVEEALRLLTAHGETRRRVGQEFFVRARQALESRKEAVQPEKTILRGESSELFLAGAI